MTHFKITRALSILNKDNLAVFLVLKTSEKKVRSIIKNLNIRKDYQSSDTSTKIIKLNIDLFSSFICQNFNYVINVGEFPNELKHAGVIPIHKYMINVIKLTN